MWSFNITKNTVDPLHSCSRLSYWFHFVWAGSSPQDAVSRFARQPGSVGGPLPNQTLEAQVSESLGADRQGIGFLRCDVATWEIPATIQDNQPPRVPDRGSRLARAGRIVHLYWLQLNLLGPDATDHWWRHWWNSPGTTIRRYPRRIKLLLSRGGQVPSSYSLATSKLAVAIIKIMSLWRAEMPSLPNQIYSRFWA